MAARGWIAIMYGGQFIQRFPFWQRFIRIVILFWLIREIGDDVHWVITGLWGFFKNHTPVSGQAITSLSTIAFCIVFLILSYIFYIFWFAQFILPVSSLSQRYSAFIRLLIFGISWGRWHGATVFVRDGELIGRGSEIKKKGPGVAFVDLRSAITLDRHLTQKSDLLPASLESPQKVHINPTKPKSFITGIRVVGPGLVFIKKNEKITGVADLRKQSRSRDKVCADTRDGIRVTTSVSCSFTIGQPPEILDVCLVEEDVDQVLVIQWDDTLPIGKKKVNSLSNELDNDDQKEIHTFILAHPDPLSTQSDVINKAFPFTFDPKQVEQAVYSETYTYDPVRQSRNLLKKWSDWPQDVATEKFRILLSQRTYMSLYEPQKKAEYPLKDFKRLLSSKVRNTGILAYRVVMRRDGKYLKSGETYQESDLIFYPSRNLNRSDALRDRGVKVLSAGFGELKPDESVRKQLMDSWLSAKRKEADLRSADYDLEVARIKNHARVQTQQSMIYHFTKLLENQEYPREALAILIYQELEAAAANPETRRLLPENTLSLLAEIRTMLLSSEKESSKPGNEYLDSLPDPGG